MIPRLGPISVGGKLRYEIVIAVPQLHPGMRRFPSWYTLFHTGRYSFICVIPKNEIHIMEEKHINQLFVSIEKNSLECVAFETNTMALFPVNSGPWWHIMMLVNSITFHSG